MKFLATTLFSVLFCVAMSGTASAQNANTGGYGTAGCGLGSLLFGNQPGLIQVLAATTNGTFGSQTFGITTGTSNCVDAAAPVVNVGAFIETNRPILAKDMARGQGETIATLSDLAGCTDSAAVGPTLQKNYRKVFSSNDLTDIQVSANVVSVLRANKDLGCKKLN